MSGFWERLWYSENEGFGIRLLARFLTPLARLFGWIVSVRNALYDLRVLKTHHVPGILIISVGNLNVGGAGKTPAVIWLAQRLLAAGKKVGVLSRGYGRKSDLDYAFRGCDSLPLVSQVGDEPLLIARSCPEAYLWVGRNKLALAHRALREASCEVLILDDGFQHRRLERQVNIAVLDEMNPWGNGQLLPRGPLRERRSALKRADLLWLRSDGGKPPPLVGVPALPKVRARYVGRTLEQLGNGGKRFFAFAGLARPSRFLKTLEQLGCEVVGHRFFGDHHIYTPTDLSRLQQSARSQEARLITTDKDALRLPDAFPAFVVALQVEVFDGEQTLLELIGVG